VRLNFCPNLGVSLATSYAVSGHGSPVQMNHRSYKARFHCRMHQIAFGGRTLPGTAGAAHSAPPGPLAALGKGGEGRGTGGEERGWKGRDGMGGE